MSFYRYKLVTNAGQVKRGLVRLPFTNTSAAFDHFERLGQIVVEIVPVPVWADRILEASARASMSRIPKESIAELLQNLSTMLRAGVVLSEALEDAVEHIEDRRVRRIGEGMLMAVRSGVSLHSAMSRYDDAFPAYVLFMVRMGEESAKLAEVLADAAAHLNRIHRLAVDMKKSLVYPAIAFAATLGALAFWLYYTVPSLTELYRQMQVELPGFTRAVLHATDLVRSNGVLTALALIAVFSLLWLAYRKSRGLQVLVVTALLQVPVLGRMIRYGNTAFMFEYLAMLIRSGIELPRAIRVIAGAIQNPLYRRATLAVQQDIERGNPISLGLRRTRLFPNYVVRMVKTGEQSGELAGQLRLIADEYTNRYRDVVDVFKTLIEPAAVLVVGALLIVMVIALFFPVYTLITHIQLGGAR